MFTHQKKLVELRPCLRERVALVVFDSSTKLDHKASRRLLGPARIGCNFCLLGDFCLFSLSHFVCLISLINQAAFHWSSRCTTNGSPLVYTKDGNPTVNGPGLAERES